MSTVTANLKTINADPTLTKLKVIGVTRPWVVHGNFIYPVEQLVTPDVNGFCAVRLVTGYYELWVGDNRVFILVPDDDNTYPFEELLVPAIDLPSPIIGGAVPTARADQAGLVWTDETVLQPVAVTGWFFKLDAAGVRAIANQSNNKVAICVALDAVFAWSATSTAADDGSTVLKPTDTGALAPGRWLKMAIGGGGGGGGSSVIFGTGSPEGAQVADPGTFFWSTDLHTFSLKLSGAGNTGWQELTA